MANKEYKATPAGLAARMELDRAIAAASAQEQMREVQPERPATTPVIPGETPEETAALDKSEHRTRGEDFSDLFETPQPDDHDIYTDDLTDVDTEDLFGGPSDMSDLTTVTADQIYGEPLMSKAERKMRRRARKLKKIRRDNPPMVIRGVRL